MRILHVTESYDAGTGIAIRRFAEELRTAGITSALLASTRGGALTTELDSMEIFEAFTEAAGARGLRRLLLDAIGSWLPDIIHAHSSIAGAVVRTVRRPLPPIVYSPHCYSFFREDANCVLRSVYRQVERSLASRTAGFVCVSPFEVEATQRLRSTADVVYVSNGHILPPKGQHPRRRSRAGALRLVSVGRLAKQKCPGLFAEIVRTLRRARFPVTATWVGDGDARMRDYLLSEDIAVTGWIPTDAVHTLLREQDLYVHTALWEGSPLTIWEALREGLPVLARWIRPFEGLFSEATCFSDIPDVLWRVEEYLAGSDSGLLVLSEEITRAAEAARPSIVLPPLYERLASAGLAR